LNILKRLLFKNNTLNDKNLIYINEVNGIYLCIVFLDRIQEIEFYIGFPFIVVGMFFQRVGGQVVADKTRLIDTIRKKFPSIEKIKDTYEALCNYLQVLMKKRY
jgi:hypothetical protein